MAHNFNKPLTGNEFLTGALGATGVALTFRNTQIAGKQYERDQRKMLGDVRRDYSQGLLSRPEAKEICKKEGIQPEQCLASNACEVRRNQDQEDLAKKKSAELEQAKKRSAELEQSKTESAVSNKSTTEFTVSDNESKTTGVDGGSRKGGTGLRGGGTGLHKEAEPNSNFNSDLNRNNDSLEAIQEHYTGSQSESSEHIESYRGRGVENDTFVGVDPNFSFGYNDGNSRFTSSVPFIAGGLFFAGFLYFKWLQKNNTWFKWAFPDETELIIENQIKMEEKLDKIHELQEKINKNLTKL